MNRIQRTREIGYGSETRWVLTEVDKPGDDTENEKRERQDEKRTPCGPEILKTGGIDKLATAGRGASADFSFFEETIVVALQEKGLDLTHGIEQDPDRNQHPGTAKEDRDVVGDLVADQEDIGEECDEGQGERAGKGQARHDKVEEFGGGFTGAYTGHVATVFLEVVRDLNGFEHEGDPEITENKDQETKDEVIGELTAPEGVGEFIEEIHPGILPEEVEDLSREHQDGAGKNDGHNAGIIDLERQEGALSAIYLAPDHALGVLHGDFTLGLRDGDESGGHDKEQCQHEDALRETELGFGSNGGGKELVSGDDRTGETGNDTNGNQEGDAVTDSLLGDLLTEPNHDHGAGGQENRTGNEELGFAHEDDLAVGGGVEARNDATRIGTERHEQHETLHQANRDGEVTGILIDLLATDIAFLLEAGETGEDRTHQLHDNGGADVGHDAEGKQGTVEQGATGKHVVEPQQSAARSRFIAQVFLNRPRVHTGKRDVCTYPGNEKQCQGKEDLLAQFRNLERIGECGEHEIFERLGPAWSGQFN